jgi:hypothetical protein
MGDQLHAGGIETDVRLRLDDRTSGVHGLACSAGPSSRPKLLDQLREALRSRHYRRRTEETCCHWAKRFICFHKARHAAGMAGPEINDFLTHLAAHDRVSAEIRRG